MPGPKPKSLDQLFWPKVDRRGPDECWEWLAGKAKSGYGQLQARGISDQPLTSHRAAWLLASGEIPDSMHVLHTCDNKGCCNPAHLFLGTQKDNNDDRCRKGRTASGDRNGARTKPERNLFVANGGSGLSGEKHPMSKVSDEQVAALREDYASGLYLKVDLAAKYGITPTHIGRLLKGGADRCRR